MTRFSGRPHGSVTAIPSKSAAHRYMICAALAQGRSVIRGLPGELPDDLTATLDCIRALGAAAVFRDDTLEITGINAKPDVLRLDCRDSGATYRLLYPVAPLIGRRAEFMLSTSLAARPMEPVTELLKSKGVAAEKLSVSGSFGPGEFPIRGDVSSQYISGLLLALSLLMLRRERMSPRARLAGIMAALSLTLGCCFEYYPSTDIYKATANTDLITPWSAVEVYISRGTTYPFLFSVQDMFPDAPEGYRDSDAYQALSQYRDADIPDEQKVTVVGIMLEAFSDLTDFPALGELSSVHGVYEPLHELEKRSVSGDLLTNIFAGGTTDTEWGFLTGYSEHEEFRSATDSFVRYFKAQGYDTLYRHPGYSWFYNRSNVNEYLGFDESVFNESGFADLISIDEALYASDAVLVDYLLNDIDTRTEDDAPLFLFSVSYQNHGPYPSETYWEEYVTPEKTGWSMESCCVVNNYLAGIRSTIEQMLRLTRELETLDQSFAEAEAGSVGDYIRTLFFSALAEAVATASGTGVSTYGSVTMVIEGVNMVAGDELIIDTEHMTVTLNGANIIDRVSDDSAFFKLQPGENDIIVEGGTTADVKILWKDRWL